MHSHPNARLTQKGSLRLVAQHLEHGRSLFLVGVGLGFQVAGWSPALGRHALEITVEVLQHMNKSISD